MKVVFSWLFFLIVIVGDVTCKNVSQLTCFVKNNFFYIQTTIPGEFTHTGKEIALYKRIYDLHHRHEWIQFPNCTRSKQQVICNTGVSVMSSFIGKNQWELTLTVRLNKTNTINITEFVDENNTTLKTWSPLNNGYSCLLHHGVKRLFVFGNSTDISVITILHPVDLYYVQVPNPKMNIVGPNYNQTFVIQKTDFIGNVHVKVVQGFQPCLKYKVCVGMETYPAKCAYAQTLCQKPGTTASINWKDTLLIVTLSILIIAVLLLIFLCRKNNIRYQRLQPDSEDVIEPNMLEDNFTIQPVENPQYAEIIH